MQPEHSYIQGGFEFGTAVDTPPLYLVTIIDINQQHLKIGYQDTQVTIGELIQTYRSVTSCADFFVEPPIFKVHQNGPYYGQIAIQSEKLASYDLSFDKPCFEVVDSAEMNLKKVRESAISRFQTRNDNKDVIPVIIQFQGADHKLMIRLSDTIRIVKEQMINQIPNLKKEIPANINLIINGYFYQDKATMESYKITANKKITAFLKSKQGCFRSNTNILVSGNQCKPIDELKVDDQIYSFNEGKGELQLDRITFVHTSLLNECIVIELNDGTVIQTTSNHLFLCQDNIFRKVDEPNDSQQRLKEGTQLKLFNNKYAFVTSISQKMCQGLQTFYHLCMKNNHNFIANGLIAHNMYLNVMISNDNIEKISIEPNTPFIYIKEQIQSIYEIQIHSQVLFYAGKELTDSETPADKNIPKQSKIYLKYKPTDQFNFLHPLTPVLTKQGAQVPICQIKVGDIIATFNPITRQPSLQGDVVVNIAIKVAKQMMKINIDSYEQAIICSADCYFQMQNGEAINSRDLTYGFDRGTWPLVRKIDGSTYEIKEIAHDKNIKQINYYKLVLSSRENYIVKNMIVHNQIVNILVFENQKMMRRLAIGVTSSDTILSVKEKLANIEKIASNKIELSFSNVILEDDQTMSSYNIKSEHAITANSKTKVSLSSIFITDSKHIKKINTEFFLQLSQTQRIPIDYKAYRDKTVEQIMMDIIPNYESSYFFLFADLIIHPHQKLKKIQQSDDQFGDNVVIIVKNQKIAFIQNMSIRGSDVTSHSTIVNRDSEISSSSISVEKNQQNEKVFKEAASRIEKDDLITVPLYKTEQFYLPFLYLTSRSYNTKMLKYIKQFQRYRDQLNKPGSFFSIIKDLYINMHSLKNYYQLCYFGLKNFRLSHFYKKNQSFYWYNFTTAYVDREYVQEEVKKHRGTLFIINSVNGKDISWFSLYPEKREILFAPFSYFMIEKIESNDRYDVVTLREIASPVTFQKNIVLWVDDEPAGNETTIEKILKINDIEILQVTSTILAEKWVKEFGWLLNWKGLKFRLISDMTRKEGEDLNFEAGVDLLQKLYKVHGITAETLIFCGNLANAQKNVKKRNIPKERYFRVTVSPTDVQNFCKMG